MWKTVCIILLVLALAAPAFAGEVFQRTIGNRLPLLQKNYLCNTNADTIDLLCGLVGYWHFQEPAWDGTVNEVVDSSGNGNHGTAAGGATTVAGGKIGRGGVFVPGTSDAITVSDAQALRMINGGTIAAWIKPESAGENNVGRVIDKASAGVNGYALVTRSSQGMSIVVGGVGSVTGDNVITWGQWNHVVAYFDSSGRRMWINNSEVTLTNPTDTTLPADVAGSVFISRFAGSAARFFDGNIDELKTWERVLSLAERTKLYNSGRGRYIH